MRIPKNNWEWIQTHCRTWEHIRSSGSPPQICGCRICLTYVSKSPSRNLTIDEHWSAQGEKEEPKFSRQENLMWVPFSFRPPLDIFIGHLSKPPKISFSEDSNTNKTVLDTNGAKLIRYYPSFNTTDRHPQRLRLRLSMSVNIYELKVPAEHESLKADIHHHIIRSDKKLILWLGAHPPVAFEGFQMEIASQL